MKNLLLLLGVLDWLASAIIYSKAEYPIHEVFAATLGVSGAVLLGAVAIVQAIEQMPANQQWHDEELAEQIESERVKDSAAAARAKIRRQD